MLQKKGSPVRKNRRRSSVSSTGNKSRQSKKSLSPSTDKSSDISPAKPIKRKSQSSASPSPTKKVHITTSIDVDLPSSLSSSYSPSSTSTSLLHAGLPTLTKYEEKRIVNGLIDHTKSERLTFDDAQSYACQLVMEIIKENFNYQMSCVQTEWFYDLLLKHPQVLFKYSHWFNTTNDLGPMPTTDDIIDLKQWQLKSMLHSQQEVNNR